MGVELRIVKESCPAHLAPTLLGQVYTAYELKARRLVLKLPNDLFTWTAHLSSTAAAF